MLLAIKLLYFKLGEKDSLFQAKLYISWDKHTIHPCSLTKYSTKKRQLEQTEQHGIKPWGKGYNDNPECDIKQSCFIKKKVK